MSAADESSIRLAKPSDAKRVSEFAKSTFPLACPDFAVAEDIQAYIDANLRVADFEKYLTDPDTLVIVAEDDEITGYILMWFGEVAKPDPSFGVKANKPAYISKCYVAEHLHRSGLAARIIERAKEEARARGADVLWLNTSQHNHRAGKFYAKNGFENVGVKTFQLGAMTDDDFVFACKL
ncbi:GNAT family N-acetyltransferase [Propionimicrobium lymphophilum]|uniref:GNAT family N-acetyltransferase n=1 Tax=Propionimicrobium lymphophilum TaxID=33012 RepID=UPI0028893A9B|nr:GNAT family N-acetyltransferase [Propionimicrobium lymphophilum]